MPSAKTMPDYYDESPIAEHADKPEIKTDAPISCQ